MTKQLIVYSGQTQQDADGNVYTRTWGKNGELLTDTINGRPRIHIIGGQTNMRAADDLRELLAREPLTRNQKKALRRARKRGNQ